MQERLRGFFSPAMRWMLRMVEPLYVEPVMTFTSGAPVQVKMNVLLTAGGPVFCGWMSLRPFARHAMLKRPWYDFSTFTLSGKKK